MMGSTNPLELISYTFKSMLTSQFPQLKVVMVGWPDTKWVQTDGNKPGLFIVEASPSVGKSSRTVLQPFVKDDATLYYELQRLQLLLQLTLITSTPDERSSLGWGILQYLITNRQIYLPDGQYSILRFRGDSSPEGKTNYYMRHLTFEAQARVLMPVTATKVATISKSETME